MKLHPLTFTLLRALSDGRFHSGAELARQFAVSRATVHNALQGVESMGLALYRIRGRGYRLPGPPHWLDAARVLAELGETAALLCLTVEEQGQSSNSLLLQRAATGAPSGTVLALEWQHGGRGRLGRSWQARLGGSLTFSLLWRFPCGLAGLSGLSLAVGVALLRALQRLGIAGVWLKWPNDLITAQGKLGGILIEAQGEMMGPSAAVIGIGLNLCLPQGAFDQPVAALEQLAPLPERNHLFAAILQELLTVLQDFERQGFAALRHEWEMHHAWQGRELELQLPDGARVRGVALGVDERGALRLATAEDERAYSSGEVSARLAV